MSMKRRQKESFARLLGRMAGRLPLAAGHASLVARRRLFRLERTRPEVPPQGEILNPTDVSCIVFSKDRALQLDACLRSIERNAPYGGSTFVIYLATNPQFLRSYELMAVNEGTRLLPQSADFRRDVLEVVDTAARYTVFHTDDDFCFRRPADHLVPPHGFACFSLRLGENTTYCYPLDREQRVPRAAASGSIITWDWTRADGDFAYPMSVNGHIFETDLVRRMLRRASFSNPNELEYELHLRRYMMPPLMLASRESCVLSVPANAVSVTANRSGEDPDYSPEALNARFLAGQRIDLNAMDFSGIRGAHQEIPFVFTSRAR
jgi:hypothetical protein